MVILAPISLVGWTIPVLTHRPEHRQALKRQTDYGHFCSRTVNFETMRSFLEDNPLQNPTFEPPAESVLDPDDNSCNFQLTAINAFTQQLGKAPTVCKGLLQRYHRYCAQRDRPQNVCSGVYSFLCCLLLLSIVFETIAPVTNLRLSG